MGLFGLQVQSIIRGSQGRNWSRDHIEPLLTGLLNPLAYTTRTTCPQWVWFSFISISNQENAPADLSTSNLMEACSSLRFFFPNNFYLCQADKETHQDSKGGSSVAEEDNLKKDKCWCGKLMASSFAQWFLGPLWQQVQKRTWDWAQQIGDFWW